MFVPLLLIVNPRGFLPQLPGHHVEIAKLQAEHVTVQYTCGTCSLIVFGLADLLPGTSCNVFNVFCSHTGQSNPPNHLSMFLEVTDSKAGSSEWSCFVSHRLSVVNQKFEGDRYMIGRVIAPLSPKYTLKFLVASCGQKPD